MNIETISDNKKRCQPQLFLGDEQGAIINRYLKRDGMFVMTDSAWRPVAVAVVTREGSGIAELKDIAAACSCRHRRLGRRMTAHIAARYAPECHTLPAGTGDSPDNLAFYRKCGVRRSHIVHGFFRARYDHEITKDGKLPVGMIYLKLDLHTADKASFR